jgi:hypothetical protein
VLTVLYNALVGSYAVLEDIEIRQHPANPGQLRISFNVVKPGKVVHRRLSGEVETELIDHFSTTGYKQRSWCWQYEPGRPIEVTLSYRGGFWRDSLTESFKTSKKADIVIIMDTTESMDASIRELKEKCITFSEQLDKQDLEHRFAFIGFGDAGQDDWSYVQDLTPDVDSFHRAVSKIGENPGETGRFLGGDYPESALDAVQLALDQPFDSDAMRRFYLVTDARYHPRTKDGKTVENIVDQLQEKRVWLHVFSRPVPEWKEQYARLLGGDGKRFHRLEYFGEVLSEGRLLED